MSGWNWMMQPTSGTALSMIWNVRGATVWCYWCRCDTDHNTNWHRDRLVKGGRKP